MYQRKSAPQPLWRGLYLVLFIINTAVKCHRLPTWTHTSQCKRHARTPVPISGPAPGVRPEPPPGFAPVNPPVLPPEAVQSCTDPFSLLPPPSTVNGSLSDTRFPCGSSLLSFLLPVASCSWWLWNGAVPESHTALHLSLNGNACQCTRTLTCCC